MSDSGARRSVELVANLERLIRERELKVGDRLPTERELAEQLGCSRTTVRESLRELELKGLLERHPGRGTTLLGGDLDAANPVRLLADLSPTERELSEVMDFRMTMEPPIAEKAALLATASELRAIDELHTGMKGSCTPSDYAHLDEQFHAAIAAATHNRLLVNVLEASAQWTKAVRVDRFESPERRRVSLEGHARIVVALESRNAMASRLEMRRHLAEITQEIMISLRHRESDGWSGR